MVLPKRTPTPTLKFQAKTTRTIQKNEETENLDLSAQLVRPVVELTTPQRNVTLEQTQQTTASPE